eukprot:6396524-Alexandrium_andersonii.AAC.1
MAAKVIKNFHVTVMHVLRKLTDQRREKRRHFIDAKARGGPRGEHGRRCDRAMDPSLLQHFTASGLTLGGSSAAFDSRE